MDVIWITAAVLAVVGLIGMFWPTTDIDAERELLLAAWASFQPTAEQLEEFTRQLIEGLQRMTETLNRFGMTMAEASESIATWAATMRTELDHLAVIRLRSSDPADIAADIAERLALGIPREELRIYAGQPLAGRAGGGLDVILQPGDRVFGVLVV